MKAGDHLPLPFFVAKFQALPTIVGRPTLVPVSFKIRKYQDEDREELWRLHVLTVVASGFSDEVAGWDIDLHSINDNYRDKHGQFLVVEASDRQLIGMGGYVPTSASSVELKRMRVHPDYQRKGIGRALLEALEEDASRSGHKRIHLDTANGAIQDFYRSSGYRFVKSEHEGEFDFHFYEKELKAP